MVKRKELKDNDVDMGGTDRRVENDSDSDEDIDMVNVDFEWFDPDPEVDFHGLKNLLRQLFDNDAQDLDMSALTDLILSQAWMGSTIKTDGKESDPYAFLTVLNLQEHKDKPIIQALTTYLRQKALTNPALSPLSALLTTPPPKTTIGLILTERLINMPAEVIPPMYTMLQAEIAHAVADREPFDFTHYLIVSKTYEEVQSKLDMEETRPQKKKKAAAGGSAERFFFHPEDEVVERHALCAGSYEYTRKQDDGHSDSKRAFQELGIRTKGSLILLEKGRLEGAVKAMAEYVGAGGQ
ncbi:protein-transporting protein BCP1 [Aspergillus homomorphus CBS 101889]|uniref:Protein BCP1 n=1 Tax=Aspergillus homomorphus (strain CBS 101889) TaxID=1450537 RepID=A0A395I331_ASPHC|nr:hypothetical protein BO97DRAFT_404139 [Aspergillus homomorphus CBS 101889]RAL14612.1 hypothetical protein BO97DRAFT_404139 [Aspergillus homomorphus CBS 101889]